MGNRHSLEDELINFRLTSKQMQRSAKKCEKNQAINKEKLKKAIEQGNMEGARIYAQNVIREKNQALNYLRLGSRIDAVAARLEQAIRTQQIQQSMVGVVKGMGVAMRSMNVEKISSTMEQFEKQFEDMDVRSAYMEDAMNSSTAMATPPEQVDNLIQMVADEAGLALGNALEEAGPLGTTLPQKEAAEKTAANDDLESRLAALRK